MEGEGGMIVKEARGRRGGGGGEAGGGEAGGRRGGSRVESGDNTGRLNAGMKSFHVENERILLSRVTSFQCCTRLSLEPQ